MHAQIDVEIQWFFNCPALLVRSSSHDAYIIQFSNIIEVKDKQVQHHVKNNLHSNNKKFIFSAKYSWTLTEHLIGSFVIPQQESLQVYNVHYIYYVIYTCILMLRQPQISFWGKLSPFLNYNAVVMVPIVCSRELFL